MSVRDSTRSRSHKREKAAIMIRSIRLRRCRPLLVGLEERALLSLASAAQAVPAFAQMPSAPLRIVLVSDAVAQAQQIVASAMPGVIALTYDSQATDSAHLVDLLASVSQAHGGARIAQLGLVAHGSEGYVSVSSTDAWDMATLGRDASALEHLARSSRPGRPAGPLFLLRRRRRGRKSFRQRARRDDRGQRVRQRRRGR